MHYTNIPPLGRNSFCYCLFFCWRLLSFIWSWSQAVCEGWCASWSCDCQVRGIAWTLCPGHPLIRCWMASPRWLENAVLLYVHIQNRQRPLRNPSPSTNIRGLFIFSQTGFSDTSCQSGKRAEQRISIPTRKMDFPEHNCPCSCHIILLYLITELPMNFSWDRGIKHLSS